MCTTQLFRIMLYFVRDYKCACSIPPHKTLLHDYCTSPSHQSHQGLYTYSSYLHTIQRVSPPSPPLLLHSYTVRKKSSITFLMVYCIRGYSIRKFVVVYPPQSILNLLLAKYFANSGIPSPLHCCQSLSLSPSPLF